MSKFVLDSYAILSLIRNEPGMPRIRSLLKEAAMGNTELYMSRINLAEVHYILIRGGQETAQIHAALEILPITVASADDYIDKVVELKARYPMSLGDCFAAALAQDHQCPLLTGDPEFHKVEDIITIEWLP